MRILVTFWLLILLLFSCKKPPNYDKTPKIAFKSIELKRVFIEANQAFKDSVSIVLRFEDGDGDLGWENNEFLDANNQTKKNFIVKTFKKTNGVYNEVSDNGFAGLSGRFPTLTDRNELGPIDGELRHYFLLDLDSPFKKGDTLVFDIYVLDRAFRQSNTIRTNEIIAQLGQ
jgi:hypothetical protein